MVFGGPLTSVVNSYIGHILRPNCTLKDTAWYNGGKKRKRYTKVRLVYNVMEMVDQR